MWHCPVNDSRPQLRHDESVYWQQHGILEPGETKNDHQPQDELPDGRPTEQATTDSPPSTGAASSRMAEDDYWDTLPATLRSKDLERLLQIGQTTVSLWLNRGTIPVTRSRTPGSCSATRSGSGSSPRRPSRSPTMSPTRTRSTSTAIPSRTASSWFYSARAVRDLWVAQQRHHPRHAPRREVARREECPAPPPRRDQQPARRLRATLPPCARYRRHGRSDRHRRPQRHRTPHRDGRKVDDAVPRHARGSPACWTL